MNIEIKETSNIIPNCGSSIDQSTDFQEENENHTQLKTDQVMDISSIEKTTVKTVDIMTEAVNAIVSKWS